MTVKGEGNECPSTYPFAYWNGGQWCCLTNMDKDGNSLTLGSQTCANDAKIKCPYGKCINYEGKFLLFSHFHCNAKIIKELKSFDSIPDIIHFYFLLL